MKNILLIGVGRFGRHLAMELNRLGHQIMGLAVGAKTLKMSASTIVCRL